MIKPMKTIYFFCLLLLTGGSLSAQQGLTKITELEKKQLQTEAIQTVNNFCKSLSRLASKDQNNNQKKTLISEILSLFKEGATMEVGTIINGEYKQNEAPLSGYLNGVAGYRSKFSFVALKFEAIKINFESMENITYKGKQAVLCKFSFIQTLQVQKPSAISLKPEGGTVSNANKIITDVTSKTGDIIIMRQEKQEFVNNKQFKVLIGDISVNEVEIKQK